MLPHHYCCCCFPALQLGLLRFSGFGEGFGFWEGFKALEIVAVSLLQVCMLASRFGRLCLCDRLDSWIYIPLVLPGLISLSRFRAGGFAFSREFKVSVAICRDYIAIHYAGLSTSIWSFCTVAFAISYNHEYSQFIHECTIAVMNTTLSWMRQLIHEG